MSDLFETYEEEFLEAQLQIESRTKGVPAYDAAERREQIKLVEKDIKSLEQTLQRMNLSGRSDPKLMAKIKDYEQEVVRLRSSLRKAEVQFSQNSRAELFAGLKSEDALVGSMSHREKLISNNERLERTNYELDSANMVALESMETGITIITDLEKQGEQMGRMKGTLHDIEGSLSKANRLIKSMARRAIKNKIILIVIALVMVAAICLIIYVKWFWNSSSSPSPSPSPTPDSGSLTTGQLTTGLYATTVGNTP